MAGTVGIICDLAARYSQFWDCAMKLRKPFNTELDIRYGSDRARSRNAIAKASLERGSEWVFFVDDDHGFAPDLLETLLAVRQPVVAALYFQRTAPFLPIAYGDKDEHGYWPLDIRPHGPNELVKVRAVGTGGMLIRSEVLRETGDGDWFLHTTEKSEDMYFCDTLHEHEIPVYVHTGARLGHFAPALVWPTYEGDKWTAGIQFSHTTSIILDIDYDSIGKE